MSFILLEAQQSCTPPVWTPVWNKIPGPSFRKPFLLPGCCWGIELCLKVLTYFPKLVARTYIICLLGKFLRVHLASHEQRHTFSTTYVDLFANQRIETSNNNFCRVVLTDKLMNMILALFRLFCFTRAQYWTAASGTARPFLMLPSDEPSFSP